MTPNQLNTKPGAITPGIGNQVRSLPRTNQVYQKDSHNASHYPITEQVPPAMVDALITGQVICEKELTYLLVCDPYGVLKLSEDYLPEVAHRERSIWQLIRKQLPPQLDYEKAIQFCLDLVFTYGYKDDFFNWQDRYMDHFFSPSGFETPSERAKQLLKEIIALHDGRIGLELAQKLPIIKTMAAYYE